MAVEVTRSRTIFVIPAMKVSAESVPFSIWSRAFSQSAVIEGDLKGTGTMEIRFFPSVVGMRLFPFRFT